MRIPARSAAILIVGAISASALGQTHGNKAASDDSGKTLRNVTQCREGIFNGSAPHTEADFAALARMGVKTIIAVDGTYPNAKRAREHGIRTVHLPIGYDGVIGPRAVQLVRAVRDLPKPVYIHCLHGKHRSPAVAAFVSIELGRMTPEQGVEYMHRMGTSKSYPGLYASVRNAHRLDPAVINAASNVFPERTPVGDLVETMVAVDTAWGHVGDLHKAGWKAPADHPDLTPANETKILVQHMEHLAELPEFKTRPDDFKQKSNQAMLAARALRDAAAGAKWREASAAYERVEQSCNACHKQYRNQ